MWGEAYGASAGSRQHALSRVDHGVKRPRRSASTSDACRTGSLPTEQLFKKRFHDQVVAKSQHVNHMATLDAYAPTVWTEGHIGEQQFNKNKLQIKRLDANMKGLVLLQFANGNIC